MFNFCWINCGDSVGRNSCLFNWLWWSRSNKRNNISNQNVRWIFFISNNCNNLLSLFSINNQLITIFCGSGRNSLFNFYNFGCFRNILLNNFNNLLNLRLFNLLRLKNDNWLFNWLNWHYFFPRNFSNIIPLNSLCISIESNFNSYNILFICCYDFVNIVMGNGIYFYDYIFDFVFDGWIILNDFTDYLFNMNIFSLNLFYCVGDDFDMSIRSYILFIKYFRDFFRDISNFFNSDLIGLFNNLSDNSFLFLSDFILEDHSNCFDCWLFLDKSLNRNNSF